MSLYSITLSLPAALSEERLQVFGGCLEAIAPSFVTRHQDNDDNKPWILTWYCEGEPDLPCVLSLLDIGKTIAGLPDLDITRPIITEMQDENWLEKSYQSFQPFHVGPFFIYGSHYDGGVPDGQIGLQIDAATAFGSGEHGTTKACLTAMLDLKHQGVCPWNILDMGTGSGILAIAAWKLWQTPILAVDIEEASIKLTKKHQDINGVKDSPAALTSVQGDGFAADLVQTKKPFELVIANILAGPLKDMAADLTATLDSNSYVILSGMLHDQADDVLAHYEACGLTLKKRYEVGEWSTLLLHFTGD